MHIIYVCNTPNTHMRSQARTYTRTHARTRTHTHACAHTHTPRVIAFHNDIEDVELSDFAIIYHYFSVNIICFNHRLRSKYFTNKL